MSRRTLLKGVGGLGAGVAAGAYDPGTATADHGEVPLALPSTLTTESWYHPESPGSAVATTRGIEQVNLAVVDDDGVWRDECGDGPGIRHRFSVAGLFQGVETAGLSVEIDEDWCGRVSLTPNYTWSGYLDGWAYDQGASPPTDGETFHQTVEANQDEVFDLGEPWDPTAFEAAANILVGGATLLTGGGLALATASLGLALGDVFGLFDEETREDVHQRDETSIDELLTDANSMYSRFVWSDFSVVVPAGESAAFDVEWTVETDAASVVDPAEYDLPAGVDAPPMTDVTQRVELPAIDAGQEFDTIEAPTIETVEGPVHPTRSDDRSVALEAETDAELDGTPSWELETADGGTVEDDGSSLSHEFADPGVYAAAVTAPRAATGTGDLGSGNTPMPDFDGYEYRATASVAVGGEPFEPDGHPEVELDAPAEPDPGQKLSFEASASSPNGEISRYDWSVYTSEPGAGRVEVVSWSPEDDLQPADSFTTALDCGIYVVEVRAADEEGYQGIASASLPVHGPDPEPTIDGARHVPVDEEVEYTYETATDVPVENQYWNVDGWPEGGATTFTHAFEEAGTSTVELSIFTACDRNVETSITVEVGECPEPAPGIEPSADDPGPGEELAFEPTYEGCSVASHTWRLFESVPEEGSVQIDSQSGGRELQPYEASLDCAGYRLELEVTDVAGETRTAEHTFGVTGPDPEVSIDGPTELAVGEEATYSYTIENDVTVANQYWTDDGRSISGRETATVTFDSAGTHTLEVTVNTECAGTGRAQLDVAVSDCDAPDVTVLGAEAVDAGTVSRYTASVDGCPVEEHTWRLYESVPEQGYVEVDSESGGSDVGSYKPTFGCGGHRVELEVTTVGGQTGSHYRDVGATGDDPDPSIQGPSELAVGEEATYSYTTGNDVTVANQYWTDDGTSISGRETATVSFDSAGTHTIEVTVNTDCATNGSDQIDVSVEACDTPDVTVLGAEAVDAGTVSRYTASVDSCGVDEHVWRLYESVQGQGYVEVDSESGGSDVGSYKPTFGCGGHRVELEVTDVRGQTGSHYRDVGATGDDPDPSISGPSELAVGESGTYSYTTGNDVTVANQYWTDDGVSISGRETATVSYDSTGSHTIEVTVNTDCATNGSDQIDVDVVEPDLSASVSASPSHADLGETVSCTPSVNSDAGVDEYEWTVTFNAPCFSDYTETVLSESGSGSPPSVSFTPSDWGSYDVELWVRDEAGQTDDASDTISGGEGVC